MKSINYLICGTIIVVGLLTSTAHAESEFNYPSYVLDCITDGELHPSEGMGKNVSYKAEEATVDGENYLVCSGPVGTTNYEPVTQHFRVFVRCVQDANNLDDSYTPSFFHYHPSQNHNTSCSAVDYSDDGRVATLECARLTENPEGKLEIHDVRCDKSGKNIEGKFEVQRL